MSNNGIGQFTNDARDVYFVEEIEINHEIKIKYIGFNALNKKAVSKSFLDLGNSLFLKYRICVLSTASAAELTC
jgi:hypothetical protein